MDNFLTKLGGIVLAIVIVLVAAIIEGTLLWLIYPHIHALFPTAAPNGIIARELGWWDSVAIVWIFHLLLKPNNVTKKED